MQTFPAVILCIFRTDLRGISRFPPQILSSMQFLHLSLWSMDVAEKLAWMDEAYLGKI